MLCNFCMSIYFFFFFFLVQIHFTLKIKNLVGSPIWRKYGILAQYSCDLVGTVVKFSHFLESSLCEPCDWKNFQIRFVKKAASRSRLSARTPYKQTRSSKNTFLAHHSLYNVWFSPHPVEYRRFWLFTTYFRKKRCVIRKTNETIDTQCVSIVALFLAISSRPALEDQLQIWSTCEPY